MNELRGCTKAQLLDKIQKNKQELGKLRVAKVTNGAQGKLAQIRVFRKKIARTLTVYNQKQKAELRESLKDAKFLPLDLRSKKTRAIRRRLTKEEASKKTLRQAKKDMYFPKRRYAVKA